MVVRDVHKELGKCIAYSSAFLLILDQYRPGSETSEALVCQHVCNLLLCCKSQVGGGSSSVLVGGLGLRARRVSLLRCDATRFDAFALLIRSSEISANSEIVFDLIP